MSNYVRLPVQISRQLVRDILSAYVTDHGANPSALNSLLSDALDDAADTLRARERTRDAEWCAHMAKVSHERTKADREAEAAYFLGEHDDRPAGP